MLHYVAFCNNLNSASAHATAVLPEDASPALAKILTDQTSDVEPGFNRLMFQQGQVLLTLCIGDMKTLLRAQCFFADAIFLPRFETERWDRWALQALMRTCRRGTRLHVAELAPGKSGVFSDLGFDAEPGGVERSFRGTFNPRWEPKASRRHYGHVTLPPNRCVVVGAGLAGAATAASLARRGWDVRVLGAEAEPADGASSLPVGLMMPQPSRDDSRRTRLLRTGVWLTRQQASQLLVNDEDWSASGVMSLRPDEAPRSMPTGAWIKPDRLVQAWLSQPGVQFRGKSLVASIQCVGDEWQLRDATQTVLAQANLVVIACAGGSVAILSQSGWQLGRPLIGFHGQISWAPERDCDQPALPATAVNGHGTFVPHVPAEQGRAWFAGATFTPESLPRLTTLQAHQANLARLAKLLPDTANALEDQFETGAVNAWQGTRFSTPDRLPLVGLLKDRNLAPNLAPLCINTGYGSRGLSWSVLCAELLVAQLGGEPYPVDASLAGALDCLRNVRPQET